MPPQGFGQNPKKQNRRPCVYLCRLCGEKGENVDHVVSGRKNLAQKEYKRRRDNVAKAVDWKLCEKYGLERNEKRYEHTPLSEVENERIKILWNVCIQCDHVIEYLVLCEAIPI